MQKRRILINAIMSMVQIAVISVTLIILYRFLLGAIGIEQLGIWSLVLATTSVTQIANFGLSGSVVKYVAQYLARDENQKVSRIIQTAVLSVAAIVGIIIVIGYPIAKRLLALVVPGPSLQLAVSILPFALISLWLLAITSIIQSGLDGYQRFDLRSLLLMAGAIFHLILCFILAPSYGILGIAYARVFENLIVLLGSWILLKRQLPLLPFLRLRWDKGILKEILNYSVSFQLISATTVFYDPITKALLSRFGGLSLVGYYEMANRMVQQFRALLVSANQVLVPVIANLMEKLPDKIEELYSTSYRLIFYLSLPLFSLIIIYSPAIAKLWIGHYERSFVLFTAILAMGWFLNVMAGPAYFSNLGSGELRWNVVGHILMASLNAGLGLLFGISFGGVGVVVGWAISLALGSAVIFLAFHKAHKIAFAELLPRASLLVTAACVIGTSLTLVMGLSSDYRSAAIMPNFSMVILFSTIILASVWFHPMRKRLVEWVTAGLSTRGAGEHETTD